MSEDYIYAVARVRARELSLLSKQDVDQLMACRSPEEVLRQLRDRGWGSPEAAGPEAILAAEEEKTWAFIGELTQDEAFLRVLKGPGDFNNLKAAIKCVVTGAEPKDVFLPGFRAEPQELLRCVRENDFAALPTELGIPGERAYKALLQEQDGQRCDVILDRACLEDVLAAARASGVPALEDYARELIATTDIKIAARGCRTGKSPAFFAEALAPCPGLDTQRLAQAAARGQAEFFDELETTPYAPAAEALKGSYSAFEKWCDDRILDRMKEQKSNPFTLGPLLAYVLARRSEIGTVRILLSGKLNRLPDETVRERLRDTYV